MSEYRSIFLAAVLCVLYGSQLVFAQSFACNFQNGEDYYDLSPLSKADISGPSSDGYSWMYFLRMCGITQGTSSLPCTGLNTMACQVYQSQPTGNTYAIAYPTDQSRPHQWSAMANGVQLIAYGGAATGCSGGYRSSVIQITCDPAATTVPTSFSAGVTEASCVYTMQLTHSSGCKTTPGGGGGGGDGGDSSSSGISGGTVFIIILCVTSFVYVAGGCFYKRYKKGTTGIIESCPNNEFWTGLPGLMKDGCLYTVNKLKSLCGGSGTTSGGTGSYETI